MYVSLVKHFAMTKQLLLIGLALSVTTLMAQPTITSEVMPGPGGSFVLVDFDAEGFNPGAAGAGVTWDFSDIDVSGTINTTQVVDADDAPSSGDFPDANIAWTSDEINYTFYNSTSSVLELWGVVTDDPDFGSIVVPYEDGEELLVFPLNYGDDNSDDFSASFSVTGFDAVREGTTTMEVDGYGTLQLPGNTYTDVLRVKVVQDYSDEIVFLGLATTYLFEQYYWFKAGVNGPLLQYIDVTIDAIGIVTEEEIGFVNQIVVDIEQAEEVAVSVYPNPVSDRLYIEQSAFTGTTHVIIRDVQGRICRMEQVSFPSSDGIDVSGLDAGIYQLQFTSDQYSASALIQVQ